MAQTREAWQVLNKMLNKCLLNKDRPSQKLSVAEICKQMRSTKERKDHL